MSAEMTVPEVQGEPQENTLGPSLRTGLKITGGLVAIGGLCGAGVGIVLTYLGNVISGYPIPPSVGIYAWNAGSLGAIGAALGPPMVWSMLRRVPLWRTLVEPAVAAVGASVVSMLFAPSFFVAAVPLAVTGAALRLRWVYRDRARQALQSGDDAAALSAPAAHEAAPRE
jgi:hypothetical protein